MIEHREPFGQQAKKIIRELAQIVPDGRVTVRPRLLGKVIQVGPRRSMVSPWSSSAVEGLAGCGIKAERFEMLRRYAVPKGVNAKLFAETLFDRMTEQVYDGKITTFVEKVEIPKVQIIPVFEKGLAILREISTQKGLGWDEQDVRIYYQLIVEKLKRNPTDAECFSWGQMNSDHCRHTHWKGEWTIDGVVQKETLFDIIRKPYFANPGNALVAFYDNSSVIDGFLVKMALARQPWTSSEYMIVTVYADGTLTFETHNFPTGVAPYPGAATGTGGRMRDQKAVGRGGLLRAACAGFFTANENLPGYHLPWEKREKYPSNLASASEIIWKASDGACNYNNPVGEPVIVGVSRAIDMRMPDGTRRAYIKPIMASGGIGIVLKEHVYKKKSEKGMLVVMIGGAARNVGFGGGSASSQSSGDNRANLDFNAVQRGDPEESIRDHRVIDACIAMRKKNPIQIIHDQGAGGVINNLIELLEPLGGIIHAGKIRLGDEYLPFIVRIGAEFQERYGLLLKPSGLKAFRKICIRESCSMELLGRITGSGRFVVYNNIKGDHPKPIDFKLDDVLSGMPQKKFSDNHVHYNFQPLVLPGNVTIRGALNRVLRNRAIGSREDLVLKGDRSVGGLVVQQQMCGPANLPVADFGAVALSHYSPQGQVMSMGEQPLKLTLDAAAGARMTDSEAMLNMAGALITSARDIKSSVNWMWALKYPGEAAALFDACRAHSQFLVDFGAPVRGKDSSSMIAKFDGETVPAPRQVIVTMQAMMPNARKIVTPDIKPLENSELWLIDLAPGKYRMGGSILGQCYNQWGNDCPDIEAGLLRRAFEAIQQLVRRDLIAAYHDRSDGGVIATLLEMAFSGNCGLSISLWAQDILRALFCEEAGAVIQVDCRKRREVSRIINDFGVPYYSIGYPTQKKIVRVFSGGKTVFAESMLTLRQTWRETSYQHRKLQINPACALEEKKNTRNRKGISYVFPSDWTGKAQYNLRRTRNQPKVAILREIGTNSDEEMKAAFMLSGFQTFDVSMKDLENGTVKNLNKFSVLAGCGGFSNGDVLGSARIWSAKIRHNPLLFPIFWEFMKLREDTLSYWTCNGGQFVLEGDLLNPDLPKDGMRRNGHPVFTYNVSRKFEARWSLVGVGPSPAIMTRGLEGCRLGVHVAHGEGFFHCRNEKIVSRIIQENLSPIRFVDDSGNVTEKYPFNSNGSPMGITSLCTPNGRHFALMPHLERSVQMRQWQYVPEYMKRLENSPWLRAFENMRNWYK